MTENGIPRFARGQRPNFFEDPAVDKLLGIVLGLAQEVAVLRDRVDTMERVMERKGSVSRADIEAFVPDAAAAAERANVRAEYLGRVFRVLQHEAGTYSSTQSEQHVGRIEEALGNTAS
jgi:hypothetical protein